MAASFDTLPIELVYHICDNVDIQTILFSFRYVCRRFYTIINSYNRYELDLSSVSKTDFHRISRMIRPENVISLTLSDCDMTPGQISLFLSLFNMNQFVNLRSLTLIQIEKSELQLLMNQVNINSLNALSINIHKNNSKSKDISTISLLSNITTANLRRLDLSMWSHEITNLLWNNNHTLQYLSLGHYVTFEQICNILSQLYHLRTLILRNCIINDRDETMMPSLSDIPINRHLTSLTFTNSRLQMNELELLLSLTPALVHLQLAGSVSSSDTILDGSRWEEFIQNKLLSLEKFEFFFRAKIGVNLNSTTIESWIVPFRSMFWIKDKSWFVTCNYIIKTATLRLYSIPICDPCITYESDFDKITYTTYPYIDNDTLIMDNVREVHMDLSLMMAAVKSQNIPIRRQHLFNKLTELSLIVNEEWLHGSIEYLSTLIDLSRLTTLGLYIDFDRCSIPNTTNNISRLLTQSFNVRSLTLSNSFCHGNFNIVVEDLCSIIPHHIKHLDIYDMDLNDIKILLTRLTHLSSITFVFLFNMPFSPNEIIRWLSQRIDFTYLVDNSSLSLWLRNKMNV